ncbi:MAG: hypothetical protein ACOY94_21775 [Bacillota bacterium]
MPWSTASSKPDKWHPSPRFGSEAGGVALYLVLAAAAVLMVLVATISKQARHELRMAIAETHAAERDAVVMAALEEAAMLAEADPDWPGLGWELSDGTTQCTPKAPYSGASYLWCRDVLSKRLVFGGEQNGYQYPVRVTWRRQGEATLHWDYGWVLMDSLNTYPDGRPMVKGVVPYKSWCRPDPDFPGMSDLGPCKQGS